MTVLERAGSRMLCDVATNLVAAAWLDLALRRQLEVAWRWVLNRGEA